MGTLPETQEEVTAAGDTIEFTAWPSKTSTTGTARAMRWPELVKMLEDAPTVAQKLDCPMFALSLFNGTRMKANVVECTGVEIDYDSELVTIEDAAEQLEKHRIRCLLYTSYTNTPGAPRWRVVVPFSGRMPIAQRARMTARVNGALWGVAAPESFDVGRAYFFGRAPGSEYKVIVVDGDGCQWVDELEELDEVARHPAKATAATPAGVALPEATPLSEREVAMIRAAMPHVHGFDDYPTWIKVGLCFKSTGAGEQAFDLWCEWAKQSADWSPEKSRKKWAGFTPPADGKGVTLGSFYHLAKEGGFDRRKVAADEINAMIDAYDGTDDALDDIRALMATGELGDASFDKCLERMKKEHGVAIGTMRAGIKAIRKESAPPVKDHRDLAKDVLDEIGEGNLLRVDRSYFAWSGSVWRPIDPETIIDRVSDNIKGQGLDVFHPAALGVAGQLRAMTPNEPDAFGAAPTQWLANFVNGTAVYDGAGRWKLRPHAREDRLLAFSPIPFGQPVPTPVFEQHERERFEGDADAETKNLFLREYLGYTLTMRNDFARYVLMLGQGRNGKGTMQEVVRMLLSLDTCKFLALRDFENRFTAAQLMGCFAVVVKEIGIGERFPDAELKQLTAKDSFAKAEFKGKDGVPFRSYAKFWMAGNTLPITSDFSMAMRHRAIIIEFNQSFIGREDTQIDEKLGAELPGILHLAMEAFGSAIERGGFTVPESSKVATEHWIGGSDPVAQFAKECCEAAPFGGESTAALYQRFRGWWEDAGVHGRPPERRAMTDRLKRIVGGAVVKQGHANSPVLRGIRLKGCDLAARLAA